jgi:hypothetical protein
MLCTKIRVEISVQRFFQFHFSEIIVVDFKKEELFIFFLLLIISKSGSLYKIRFDFYRTTFGLEPY